MPIICCHSSHNQVFLFHFSRPHTWYPNARKKSRKVIVHVGPTNSGKTHHALKRLESSSSGTSEMLIYHDFYFYF